MTNTPSTIRRGNVLWYLTLFLSSALVIWFATEAVSKFVQCYQNHLPEHVEIKRYLLNVRFWVHYVGKLSSIGLAVLCTGVSTVLLRLTLRYGYRRIAGLISFFPVLLLLLLLLAAWFPAHQQRQLGYPEQARCGFGQVF